MTLRNFVFTCNNYSEDDINSVKTLLNLKYLILGYENVSTPHLQGYCELSKSSRFSSLKKTLPRFHIEKRQGTAQQASDYCKKEGKFEEIGEISKQGKRNDIQRVIEAVQDGSGIRSIMLDTATNFQTVRIAEKALTYFEKERDWKPFVCWFHGPTGTGKSLCAA